MGCWCVPVALLFTEWGRWISWTLKLKSSFRNTVSPHLIKTEKPNKLLLWREIPRTFSESLYTELEWTGQWWLQCAINVVPALPLVQVLCPDGLCLLFISVLLIAIPRVVPMVILAGCGVHVYSFARSDCWANPHFSGLTLVLWCAFQACDAGWLSGINIAGSI